MLAQEEYQFDGFGRVAKERRQLPVLDWVARDTTYDRRGFLTSETHPEKTGAVTYSGYDALGHAGRKVDGPSDLSFEYDDAERVTEIRETGGDTWKSFSYAAGNGTPTARTWATGCPGS